MKRPLVALFLLLFCFQPPFSIETTLKPRTGYAAAQTGATSSQGRIQACSYDGSPVSLDPSAMNALRSESGADVVAFIMKYTGLPQNFEVIPHPAIPNAAAVILLGPDKLPKRVIAYNERFMREVLSATANNNWAPVSIMAHEIGHHLSGHTIQPGGSQPATELEADKFSGFVLYKMGARLDDATKAINTLASAEDGPTHPGRPKRALAITEGWREACRQQSTDCSGVSVKPAQPAASTAAAEKPVQPISNTQVAEKPAQPQASASQPASNTQAPEKSVQPQAPQTAPVQLARQAPPVDAASVSPPAPGPGQPAVDVLPAPDKSATPSKFGKFVIDELGILDPKARAAFEKKMYDLAAVQQIEIVTIVAKSLHGLTADDYAYAMMRQLRAGKLDTGNGAVLVAAPGEKQVGVAMGPGLMLEMREYIDLEKDRLQSFLDLAALNCKGVCNEEQTSLLFEAADHIASNAGAWSFTIAFQNLGELLATAAEADKARMQGSSIDPENDPTWRKIARIEGKLVSRTPQGGPQAKWINGPHAEMAGAPMHVVTPDSRNLLIYANPHTESLMTTRLAEGGSYVFIVREASLSLNPEDTLSFDLLSYDTVR